MSANSRRYKKSNRKRQRRQQSKTKAKKFMKLDDIDFENKSLGRHCVQLSESFRDQLSNNDQGHQDFDESLIMSSKSMLKDHSKVETSEQTFIKAFEQMSNMICKKLDQNNHLLQQLLSQTSQPSSLIPAQHQNSSIEEDKYEIGATYQSEFPEFHEQSQEPERELYPFEKFAKNELGLIRGKNKSFYHY